MKKTILMTGFEPFGGEQINPTERLVRDFAGTNINEFEVVGVVLPVVHKDAAAMVCKAIEQKAPFAVIGFGQAGGRTAVTPEKYAVNVANYSIPDNAQNQPKSQPIVENGPVAYFSSLSVDELVFELVAHGLPAYVSYGAGTYVCNEVFYAVSHFRKIHRYPPLHGFVHVPYIREQQVQQSNPKPWVEYAYLYEAVSIILDYVSRKWGSAIG